jgi:hypothetical protein
MAQKEESGKKGPTSEAPSGPAESSATRRRSNVILAILFVYVILLGIGTVAELFDIESILSWPIYR